LEFALCAFLADGVENAENRSRDCQSCLIRLLRGGRRIFRLANRSRIPRRLKVAFVVNFSLTYHGHALSCRRID